MPYVSPAAIVTGTTISKSTFGDVVKADLDFFANPPTAIARRAAAQSIPNAAWTLITFDTEDRDTDNMFVTGANGDRITIVTAGLYHVVFRAGFPANVTGDRVFQICKGVVVDTNSFARSAIKPSGVDSTQTISGDIPLIVGDTVSGQVFQSSGGALNTDTGAYALPRMSARWVSS